MKKKTLFTSSPVPGSPAKGTVSARRTYEVEIYLRRPNATARNNSCNLRAYAVFLGSLLG